MSRLISGGLTRRRFMLSAAAGGAAFSLFPGLAGRASAQEAPLLAISLRSLSNPYHAAFAAGGQAFGASINQNVEVLVTEGNSEKGIADVRALLARSNGNLALCIDPNDSPDARVIVEECQKAGATVVTIWNKPDDLHPWDHNPSYVSHISFDGVQYGRLMGEALFGAMGGSGGIVALGGILANVPAIERKLGLDEAIAGAGGAVTLLDYQAANWLTTEAFEITQAWLTRFGSEIKGIWAANDGMAMGAIEALRAEGLAGSIPVTGIDGIAEAVEAVRIGEMVGTVDWDPNWIGGMGLSLAYHAKTGELDIAAEPNSHREFYGTGVPVLKDNVEAFLAAKASPPPLDYKDFWGRVQGQIQYRSAG